jgi:hypothetical protein
MPRLLAPLAALLLAAFPMTPRAEDPMPAGRIESDEGRVELLGRPLRAGDRIDLPEGYLVVEEDGPADGQIGSFAVVSAASFSAVSAPGADAPAAGDPGPASPGAPPCTAERSAYLGELWRSWGIEVSDPAAFLDALEGGATGPSTGFSWFALQADPFRPLAWSSALRARAEALARCVREGAAPGPAAPSLAGR